jgi:hypothetical protein
MRFASSVEMPQRLLVVLAAGEAMPDLADTVDDELGVVDI